MLSNRSMPRATVIPVLAYPDVNRAAAWLCDAFNFSIRLRIGDHRVQMNVGDGAVILRELHSNEVDARLGVGHSVMVRTDNVDDHYTQARNYGVNIKNEPMTYPYGERQYMVEDFAGYSWTFSQSMADIHPEEWGGQAQQL
jgi:uncharacterized glyoxalase superfamily protein PhnB